MRKTITCTKCGGIGRLLWRGGKFILCGKCEGKGNYYDQDEVFLDKEYIKEVKNKDTRDNTIYHGYKGVKRGNKLYGFKVDKKVARGDEADPNGIEI